MATLNEIYYNETGSVSHFIGSPTHSYVKWLEERATVVQIKKGESVKEFNIWMNKHYDWMDSDVKKMCQKAWGGCLKWIKDKKKV